MSAVAFAITEPKIVLLSDGMATKDGEIYELDCSKIHKINDRVALLWMGVGAHMLADPLIKQIETLGLTEPEDIAIETGKILRQGYKDSGNEHILDTLRFWVTTIGYDSQGNLKCFQLDSQENYRYEPKESNIKPGQLGSMVNEFDYDQASFSRLVATKYFPMGHGVEWAAKHAFEEMLSDYEQRGIHVGGQRFMEVLTPYKALEATTNENR